VARDPTQQDGWYFFDNGANGRVEFFGTACELLAEQRPVGQEVQPIISWSAKNPEVGCQ